MRFSDQKHPEYKDLGSVRDSIKTGTTLVHASAKEISMAKNKVAGDNKRVGAVKARSQVKSGLTGKWTKRDGTSGKFLDQKDDAKPFKGVRKEK